MNEYVNDSIMIDDLENEAAPAASSGSVVIEIVIVIYLIGGL